MGHAWRRLTRVIVLESADLVPGMAAYDVKGPRPPVIMASRSVAAATYWDWRARVEVFQVLSMSEAILADVI